MTVYLFKIENFEMPFFFPLPFELLLTSSDLNLLIDNLSFSVSSQKATSVFFLNLTSPVYLGILTLSILVRIG